MDNQDASSGDDRAVVNGAASVSAVPASIPSAITQIRVFSTYESCERTTYYVEIISEEGFEMCVSSHRTGSVYTNFEGLTKEEARDRALCDADQWGDFLRIMPKPFTENGVVVETSFRMRIYETRRALTARAKQDAKAIEAQSDKTGTGLAVGESAAPAGSLPDA